MSNRPRAEIAGGGIAGLASAIMFARRGWDVHVHERNEQIREVGAGLFLRTNPLRVLEYMGLREAVSSEGWNLAISEMRDGKGRLMQNVEMDRVDQRLWICPRQVVIKTLEAAAREAGVTIWEGSQVVGARAEGVLLLASGEEREADIVVGADGVSSPVRESLGMTRTRLRLPTLATRYMAQTTSVGRVSSPVSTMYWSGKRRIGVSSCSPTETYVFMISPEDDEAGKAIPMDVESWTRSFPVLEELLAGLAPLPAIQHNYNLVQCSNWQKGKVAILGDAAHALPPLLGQGAGLALSNSYALVKTVADFPDDVSAKLPEWEAGHRHFADQTQKWSMRLDTVTNKWPTPLLFARRYFLWSLGRKSVHSTMRVADSFPIEARAAE